MLNLFTVRTLADSAAKLRQAQLQYRAINSKNRQQILVLLNTRGPLSVKQIYETLKREQSWVSQQLTILRAAKLVRYRDQGQENIYSLCPERLALLMEVSIKLTLNS